MKKIYLGLGSNLSPRKGNLTLAIKKLKEKFPNNFFQSSVYETAPLAGLDQPAYLNQVVSFYSDLSASSILSITAKIELELGRIRTGKKWDSRIIDIDILLYGKDEISEQELIIPHYDLVNRDFFLIPMLEIDPDLINFRTNKSYSEDLVKISSEQQTNPQIIA